MTHKRVYEVIILKGYVANALSRRETDQTKTFGYFQKAKILSQPLDIDAPLIVVPTLAVDLHVRQAEIHRISSLTSHHFGLSASDITSKYDRSTNRS